MKSQVKMLLDSPAVYDSNWIMTSPAVWIVYDPDGIIYPTIGTTTQGLQEAINLAHSCDADLVVEGGGTGAVIICQNTVSFPPIRHRTIRIYSTTIDISTDNSAPGMVFDSCMMADFYMSGQIPYHGTGRAVCFSPTNPTVPENQVSITASRFSFMAIACMSQDGFGVYFSGPIDRNEFFFMEINGKNDATGTRNYHGIEINSNFVGNDIHFQNIHAFKGSSLRVGIASTSSIYGNRYRGVIAPCAAAGSTSVGVQVFSQNDLFEIAIINNEGVCNIGVKLEASSNNCYFLVPRNNAITKKQIIPGGSYKGWLGD